ncbi:MAG: SGNH/GDSL hydrolase family protein [Planctomycetota bacterium]
MSTRNPANESFVMMGVRKLTRETVLYLTFCLACGTLTADSPIRPGDRVAIVGNTFADQLRMHGYLETLLKLRTGDEPVSVRNLGWGGDMLGARDRPTNFPSEEATLTAHQTDVIIACFGMGESFAGEAGIESFQQQLRTFFASHAGKRYNGHSDVRLVLVSPIAYEDLGVRTPRHEQRQRELETYSEAMRRVASAEGIPFVDLHAVSRYLMEEPEGTNLTSNGIHLTAYGYWALSETFSAQLLSDEQVANRLPWQLTIDAQAVTGEGRGVTIQDIFDGDGELQFEVKEDSFPSLPPPQSVVLPAKLQLNRDTLFVENLRPGMYRLTVDGDLVALADAAAWSAGVPVDASPAHRALEAYRQRVNDKNLQFTYGWKALNQVHIVGERKKSPSGRALPGEVIQFQNSAIEQEAALREGLPLTTRHWKLARIGR